MADLTLRLVKGTELTFGELDANFLSLDSDITVLTARFDSIQGSIDFDSTNVIGIVDSAYVNARVAGAGLIIDATAPSTPAEGQMWLDPDSDMVRIWDGSVWFEFPTLVSGTGLDSAGVLQLLDSHWDSNKTIQLLDSKGVQNIIPLADSTYDLGSPSLKWRELYLSGNTIHLGSIDIKSGTDGVYANNVKLATIDSVGVDSARAVGIIDSYVDSAFIHSHVTILDSADVTQLLDSLDGSIIPSVGETYDLGTSQRRWRNIYVKDLFVSPATIHFSDSAETPQSTISLDSFGEFQLQSPTQTGFIATSTTGTAFDSNTILSIIDSAYVQSRVLFDRFDDSADIRSMIDSAYIQSRQIVGGSPWDSAKTTSIIDSAYVQSRVTFPADQVGLDSTQTINLIDSAYVQARQVDLQRDSAFITNIVDSAYIQFRQLTYDFLDSAEVINLIDSAYVNARANAAGISTTDSLAEGSLNLYYTQARAQTDFDSGFGTKTTTDLGEGTNLYYTTARHDSDTLAQVDSAYVQQRVRGPEMIAGGRIKMSAGGIWTQNGSYQKQLFGIWDSGQGPGGTDGIDRLNTGLYKFQFDSANLARITSGDDYTVMVTADYGANDPTASSRTVSVMVQADSSFQIVWERSDTGDNENYADEAHINFQVWLY